MSEETRIAVFGSPVDARAVEQLKNVARDERVVAAALMADHHVGYSMPIGGVAVYENAISPSGVGFDIACGNKAALTDIRVEDLGETKPILREIQRRVAFGLGRKNRDRLDAPLFDDPVWPQIERLSPGLKQKARDQLGTVGSGNHYVDLLADESGRVWVANHFGSRGLGHTIASGFLSLAAGRKFTERVPESEDPTVFGLDSDTGALYFDAMRLAGEYAYAGRDYVVEQVLGILGARALQTVHNHHNYAWIEGGKVVVRKGATPLTREPAFIGGSMGDASVIVRGTGEDIGNLTSAPHGAGRVMSRTKAAGKFVKVRGPDGRRRRVRDKSTAAVDWDAARADLDARGIVVLGAGADEAPQVYKSLREVLSHHPNIEVTETLRPLGVIMAGDDELDPYRD
jgi:tRNA-splicing ligase RtcB